MDSYVIVVNDHLGMRVIGPFASAARASGRALEPLAPIDGAGR